MILPARTGTSIPGAESEQETARWVRRMFGSVARRYDFLNHLLSLNIDRLWRRRAVHLVAPVMRRPQPRVLDLCCGTGDLTLALQHEFSTSIVGCDFCHPMLLLARRKAEKQRVMPSLLEADALSLPIPDGSIDLVTTAFGFRNLANYEKGLIEILRVLRPSGMLLILEFSRPPNRLASIAYNCYSSRILPLVGGIISGSSAAYSYLPKSVQRFPSAEELAQAMEKSGFVDVRFERMSWGIVALHLGAKRG